MIIIVFFFLYQKVESYWNLHHEHWNTYILLKDDILVKYVMGHLPLLSQSWCEVDVIYVSIIVYSIHWILGVIHLSTRRI